jgi:hypothetical protein
MSTTNTNDYQSLHLNSNDQSSDQPERQGTYTDWNSAKNPLPAHYLDVDIASNDIDH